MADWTKTFFRKGLFTPGMREAMLAAPREANFLWKALRLKRGSRVLDLCCGTGRHAIRIARKGASVVGVDATREYLDDARSACRGLSVELRQGDMRKLPFRGEFDAAYNVWTSFGYFKKFSDDMRTLKAVAKSLKPGGLFLIDIIDSSWTMKNYQERRWNHQADGAVRLEESTMRQGRDPAMLAKWTIIYPDKKPVASEFFVRSYDERRMNACLRAAGFVPLKRWRSLTGGAKGPRLTVLARKK